MTKTIITRQKLMSSAYNNVFDTINTRSNVADPRNVNDVTRKFVYKNDPWSKGNDYDSYPYIIVRFPSIEKSKVSADGNVKEVEWKIPIIVRTAMNGSVNNNGDSTGVSNMEDIIDDLQETFDSKTVKDELRLLRMFKLLLVQTDGDEFVDSNGKHVFVTDLELTFTERIKVGV